MSGAPPPDRDRPGPVEPEAASYAPLRDALVRAVSVTPGWRRWAGWRGLVAASAVVLLVLVLGTVTAAAPWDRDQPPARPAGQPAGAKPAGGGRAGTPPGSAVHMRQTPPSPSEAPPEPATCPAALSVAVEPDLADLVTELAGSLGEGDCPLLTVRARDAASVLRTLTGTEAPDVWIPGSSLWLRLAGPESPFPTQGTSVARTPVVMAFPTPLYDRIKGPNVLPAWVMIYHKATEGEIPRLSMPHHDTTVGALALVAMYDALLTYSSGDPDAAFLHSVNLRNHLASTTADVAGLLDRLAGTSPARSATGIGIFPATEQQLLAYQERDTAVPVTLMGLYDAITEADYPLVVSATVDRAGREVADRLRQRLGTPEAVRRLVRTGFRAPDGAAMPAGVPDYPEPVALPDPAAWQELKALWTWTPAE